MIMSTVISSILGTVAGGAIGWSLGNWSRRRSRTVQRITFAASLLPLIAVVALLTAGVWEIK